eukprot:s1959_g2.t1
MFHDGGRLTRRSLSLRFANMSFLRQMHRDLADSFLKEFYELCYRDKVNALTQALESKIEDLQKQDAAEQQAVEMHAQAAPSAEASHLQETCPPAQASASRQRGWADIVASRGRPRQVDPGQRCRGWRLRKVPAENIGHHGFRIQF